MVKTEPSPFPLVEGAVHGYGFCHIVRQESAFFFKVGCVTVQEMRGGPSEPACRSGLQTTLSCSDQESGW